MKNNKRLNILTFSFIIILLIASILASSIGYVGFMKIEEINTYDNHYELVLSGEDMREVSFNLKKDELIDFSSQPNESNIIPVSNFINHITIGKEYFFDLNIYKSPSSLVKGNEIRYIKEY
nr:hypothetical protein [Paenibacillus bovis]